MVVNIYLMGSESNPNKVIIAQQATEHEGVVKLVAYPSCCPGEYIKTKEDTNGKHVCTCGSSTQDVFWWEAWFYLTEMTSEVLPEWLHYWTGIEEKEIGVKIKWL